MQAITYAARSDTGHKREKNEDNLFAGGITLNADNRNKPFSAGGTASMPCLFAVCDGMGGYADGDFASMSAIDMLAKYAGRIKTAEPPDALVDEYVINVNKLLCGAMLERSVRMGTTLALIVAQPGGLHAYTLGDSRIYMLNGGVFKQISTDHTLVTPKIKLGLLTDEQARKKSDWHKLTAYLGVFDNELEICADTLPVLPLCDGLRILACSDGLTDMVLDGRIEEILRGNKTPAAAADFLMEEALNNGGKDNITIIVFDITSAQTGGVEE